MCLRRTAIWPAQPYNIFPHYLINGTTFKQQLLSIKCVFLFLYKVFILTYIYIYMCIYIYIYMYIYICVYIYTGCPGGNVPDFGRMFRKLKYTDITQNTSIRSWTVTEIMAREKCGLLAVPPTLPGSRDVLPYIAHVRPSSYSRVKRTYTATAHIKCVEH